MMDLHSGVATEKLVLQHPELTTSIKIASPAAGLRLGEVQNDHFTVVPRPKVRSGYIPMVVSRAMQVFHAFHCTLSG